MLNSPALLVVCHERGLQVRHMRKQRRMPQPSLSATIVRFPPPKRLQNFVETLANTKQEKGDGRIGDNNAVTVLPRLVDAIPVDLKLEHM